MYVAMVPCWHCFEDTAECWECLGKPGEIDHAQIRAYGDFLGSRYGDGYVVWLLGGDAAQDGLSREAHDRYSLLANSIATAAGGHDEVLIGVQPTGESSSSRWFHTDGWLDLNTLQSGHELDRPNYDLIAEDYRKVPVKPTHEGESIYEDIPELFGVSVDNPRASAWDERKSAYWGVFAGGFGHTYGANGIWSWALDGEVGNTCCGIRYPWYDALDFPGASQMQHLRRLMESRPFLDRIPDQGIIASEEGRAGSRVQATRASDGSYAMVYISDGHEITVDLSKVRGTVRAWWFDPRQGTSAVIRPVLGWGNTVVHAADERRQSGLGPRARRCRAGFPAAGLWSMNPRLAASSREEMSAA